MKLFYISAIIFLGTVGLALLPAQQGASLIESQRATVRASLFPISKGKARPSR